MRDMSKVNPRLVAIVNKILNAMEALGYPMMVTDTIRTLDEQQALYAQGRTKPGMIVTYADGIKVKSNHQAHEDGLGHAVDMTFVVDGNPSWDIHLPWSLYGHMAKVLGASWGGDWHHPDMPHIEVGD